MQGVEVFISYAHADRDLQQELLRHMKVLEHQGLVRTWYDRNIDAGDDLDDVIMRHLGSAQIILLLVSADFLSSEYCWAIETNTALDRHVANTARVVPVILRDCQWQRTPLAKIKALPEDGVAVTNKRWSTRDEAFTNVVEGLAGIITNQSSRTSDQSKPQIGRSKTDDWTAAIDFIKERLPNGIVPERGSFHVSTNLSPWVQEVLTTAFPNRLDTVSDRELDFWLTAIGAEALRTNRAASRSGTTINRIIVASKYDLLRDRDRLAQILVEQDRAEIGFGLAIWEDFERETLEVLHRFNPRTGFSLYDTSAAVAYWDILGEERSLCISMGGHDSPLEDHQTINAHRRLFSALVSECYLVNQRFRDGVSASVSSSEWQTILRITRRYAELYAGLASHFEDREGPFPIIFDGAATVREKLERVTTLSLGD